jgi:hypothetical protein
MLRSVEISQFAVTSSKGVTRCLQEVHDKIGPNGHAQSVSQDTPFSKSLNDTSF